MESNFSPALHHLRGAYHILYVSASAENFVKAERMHRNGFDPWLKRETINEHFRLRELWESRQYEKVSKQELSRLRKNWKRFNKPQYESLYAAWKLAASNIGKMAAIPAAPMGRLSTILVHP